MGLVSTNVEDNVGQTISHVSLQVIYIYESVVVMQRSANEAGARSKGIGMILYVMESPSKAMVVAMHRP